MLETLINKQPHYCPSQYTGKYYMPSDKTNLEMLCMDGIGDDLFMPMPLGKLRDFRDEKPMGIIGSGNMSIMPMPVNSPVTHMHETFIHDRYGNNYGGHTTVHAVIPEHNITIPEQIQARIAPECPYPMNLNIPTHTISRNFFHEETRGKFNDPELTMFQRIGVGVEAPSLKDMQDTYDAWTSFYKK